MERPESKEFPSQLVSRDHQLHCIIEQSFLVLNAAQYEKEMMMKRRVKDPALPTCLILNGKGKYETVYVFKNPCKPHREMRLQSVVGESQHVHLMERSGQLHEEQGDKVFESAASKHLEESSLKQILHFPQHLCSISEYKAKLKEKYGGNVGGDDCKAGPDENMIPIKKELHDKELDMPEDDADEEEGEPIVAAKLERMPSDMFGLQAGVGGDSASTSGKKAKTPPSTSKKEGQSVSGRGPAPVDKASTLEWAPGEDGGDILNTPDSALTSEQILYKYKTKLCLKTILAGTHVKFGVQRRFAGDAVKKVKAVHQAQLKAHIRLADLAHSLASKDVDTMNSSELQEAVACLQEEVGDWPPGVIKALYIRRVQEVVQPAMAECQPEKLKEVLHTIRPYQISQDLLAPWDLLKPCLHQLKSIKPQEKLQMYSEVLLGDMLVPLLQLGDMGVPKLSQLLKLISSEFEKHLIEEIDECYVEMIADLLSFSKGCLTLLSDDALEQLAGFEDIEKIKKCSKGVGASPLHILCNTLGECAWHAERL